jgi:hypothetical protein
VPADTSIRVLVSLLSLAVAGCAGRYSGRVVDAHLRPVPHAHVEGHGMHHAFPLGEALFVRSTVADGDGKFTLVSSDWPDEIIATSPDSKRSGRVWLPVSNPPYVIVIQ